MHLEMRMQAAVQGNKPPPCLQRERRWDLPHTEITLPRCAGLGAGRGGRVSPGPS